MKNIKLAPVCALFMMVGCYGGLEPAETTGFRQTGKQLVNSVRRAVKERGIKPLPAPPPVSDQLFELGRALAFDKVLSGNRNISCLTCHHPAIGSDDDRSLPLGEGGTGLGATRSGGHVIPRNAPALFNLHTFETMFWDSRVAETSSGKLATPAGSQLTPEMEAVFDFGIVSAQAMFPVTSREEMRGMSGSNELADLGDSDFTGIWSALMNRLGAYPQYVSMFEAAYPGTPFEDMTFAHAANAIAGFEIRGFDKRDSPWQRFLQGQDNALNEKQLRGAVRFFEAKCDSCHSGSTFSDFGHHNVGLAQFGPGKGHGAGGVDDFGREGVSNNSGDRYAFRTTPLSNVALTGPFGHAGQYKDLGDFIFHYAAPEEELLEYVLSKECDAEPHLWSTLVDNADEVLERMSPLMDALDMTSDPVTASREMQAFMEAMTDPSATKLHHLVPASVPSGLPVAD